MCRKNLEYGIIQIKYHSYGTIPTLNVKASKFKDFLYAFTFVTKPNNSSCEINKKIMMIYKGICVCVFDFEWLKFLKGDCCTK